MLPSEPHWVTSFRHALVRMEAFMAGASLLLLLSLVFGQVLARNFFETGIPNADILSRYMVLYVAFFGATLAVDRHKHIRIDVVAACLNPDRIKKLRSPLYLISAVVCGIMTWAAIRFWYDDWQYVGEHERWSSVLALITPFGFSLLSLHFLLGGLFMQPPDAVNDS
jgi:TRAP-type C4-dicarboxylate transport system permease small subunit